MTGLANLKQQLAGAGRVGVLAGGKSAERDISLQSGDAIFAALESLGVNAVWIDAAEMTAASLQHIDRAFLALHGPGGEDGTIQGYLEYLDIPYTGSGVMASAIGMDKLRCKWLWQGAGLPTPAFAVASDDMASIELPVMVKPANEGSSLGMSLADTADELRDAIGFAAQFDSDVLVERYIDGAEFTVAILGDKALPAIRLETDNRFYDFNAKYERDDTRYLCPCGLPEAEEKQLAALAVRAFELVGGQHWGRVDVMQDKKGNFYLLEVNTAPGMTSHSLVPMAAKQIGISFEQLVGEILRLSLGGA